MCAVSTKIIEHQHVKDLLIFVCVCVEEHSKNVDFSFYSVYLLFLSHQFSFGYAKFRLFRRNRGIRIKIT